jgi:hypothetical protein
VETILLPVPGRDGSPLLKQLRAHCARAAHLEELITFWVRPNQTMVVGFRKEGGPPALTISFLHISETVATAQIPYEAVLSMFPALVPLCETVLSTEQAPGFRPNDVWFDQRNARLGIVVDEELDTNIAPPESILELVLSYALSSAGFVEIQRLSEERNNLSCLIKFSLVFLGLEEQQGWYETVLIDRRSLKQYLRQRSHLLH